ncbi:hypothetical protein [Morganella morganii]|uniref:hypothetical protein n=1 Tax=Morganella morganii TaxID=582 RepID=UPI00313A3792
MASNNTWGFSTKFANEFKQFPQDQQDKVLDFIDVYEEKGLSDFSCYEGKISNSWRGLEETDARYVYARDNKLWHYHIGIPVFRSQHGKYKTSDWVLHFQWEREENSIVLVDMYKHYTKDGIFYLPSSSYLECPVEKAS